MGIKLNANNNRFNLFEIIQITLSFVDKFFLYFNINQLIPNNNKFTAGPAKAMIALCNEVAPAGIATYAGANINNGNENNFITTPINNPNQKI